MTVGIYGIFDSETDECLYVGKSIQIEERYSKHLRLLTSETHIRKDFVEWFIQKDKDRTKLYYKTLEESIPNDKTLNLLEIKWFKELKPKFYGEEPSDMKRWGASEKVREMLREKRNNPLSLTKEELELLYNSKSVKEISKETNRSERQIYNLLKKFEIITHKEKMSKISKEKECVVCSNVFTPLKKTVLTCSKKCAGKLSAKNNTRLKNKKLNKSSLL